MLALTNTAVDCTPMRASPRTGHRLVGLLRQSAFRPLASYEDVNDAERLCRDPTARMAGKAVAHTSECFVNGVVVEGY